jgi:hypothetical protein
MELLSTMRNEAANDQDLADLVIQFDKNHRNTAETEHVRLRTHYKMADASAFCGQWFTTAAANIDVLVAAADRLILEHLAFAVRDETTVVVVNVRNLSAIVVEISTQEPQTSVLGFEL